MGEEDLTAQSSVSHILTDPAKEKKKRYCKAGDQIFVQTDNLCQLLQDGFGKTRKSKGKIRLCVPQNKELKLRNISESNRLSR